MGDKNPKKMKKKKKSADKATAGPTTEQIVITDKISGEKPQK
ncbi:MAG: hypothetical protein RSD08_07850 [Oscillospiraceae bacterium]